MRTVSFRGGLVFLARLSLVCPLLACNLLQKGLAMSMSTVFIGEKGTCRKCLPTTKSYQWRINKITELVKPQKFGCFHTSLRMSRLSHRLYYSFGGQELSLQFSGLHARRLKADSMRDPHFNAFKLQSLGLPNHVQSFLAVRCHGSNA